MPYKFNESRRHKIPKQKFKVTNWAAYNESLRRRGDLTVWISDEALAQWSAPRRTSRGGQPKYSDLAITMRLTLRVVYGSPLRQTQGMMRSIATLMGAEIAVPDFSTLSRRGKGLVLPPVRRQAASNHKPAHLVGDSTGLKIFGEGEWLENKHKIKVKRKKWRKLHLGLDLVSGDIICSDLTQMMLVIRRPCLTFWARLKPRFQGFSPMVPMMDRQPAIFLLHDLMRSLRSLFHRPGRQFKARNRLRIESRAITISPRLKPKVEWPGRNPPAITSAAGSKPKWADGRQGSGRNSSRGISTIRSQKQRSPSGLSTR